MGSDSCSSKSCEQYAHFPFPFLSDVAVPPVAPGSGDTVGVFSLSIFFSPLIVFDGGASFLGGLSLHLNHLIA